MIDYFRAIEIAAMSITPRLPDEFTINPDNSRFLHLNNVPRGSVHEISLSDPWQSMRSWAERVDSTDDLKDARALYIAYTAPPGVPPERYGTIGLTLILPALTGNLSYAQRRIYIYNLSERYMGNCIDITIRDPNLAITLATTAAPIDVDEGYNYIKRYVYPKTIKVVVSAGQNVWRIEA